MCQVSLSFKVAVTLLSILFGSLFIHGVKSAILLRKDEQEDDKSSLDQDLYDILQTLPMEEICRVVRNHAKYSKQVADTVAFFKDQKRYLCQELAAIPHVRLYLFILKELKLDVDKCSISLSRFWDSLPSYEGDNISNLSYGGLTGMVSKILRLVPKQELHNLLIEKTKESRSFRTLLETLKILQFDELCNSIQENVVYQRNLYWAKESGLEIVFAAELVEDLYVYLTHNVA